MPDRSRTARTVAVLYVAATAIALEIINYAASSHLAGVLLIPAALSYAVLAVLLYAYQRRGPHA